MCQCFMSPLTHDVGTAIVNAMTAAKLEAYITGIGIPSQRNMLEPFARTAVQDVYVERWNGRRDSVIVTVGGATDVTHHAVQGCGCCVVCTRIASLLVSYRHNPH